MAKYETRVMGNFDQIVNRIENTILNGSFTATLEESSDFMDGNARCAVRVFERYSAIGNNRVSLSVTLFMGASGQICVSAASSGGSQAMFFKWNTIGETAFLDQIRNLFENEYR